MMKGIDSITLRRALPCVFEHEAIPPSEIWLAEALQITRGSHVLVEAASGTGKSSLCAYLYGARTDYKGEILFNSEDIRKYGMNEWLELRRRHIAYLPQELSLFPELTAMQNIMLKNSLTGYATEKEIRGWMEMLGIDTRADYPAGRMSIGQQQRVAIIRTLCQPYDVILLDEPVSHLDAANNRIAAAMVAKEASRQNATIIATSVGNQLLLEDYQLLKL